MLSKDSVVFVLIPSPFLQKEPRAESKDIHVKVVGFCIDSLSLTDPLLSCLPTI